MKDDATDLKKRFGVFGDIPSRIVRHAVKITPWFLEPILITGWTLLFFGIAKCQRRAVASNLRALFPEWSALRAQWGAWRVFRNFAVTFIDGLRCETGTGGVDWIVEGSGIFAEISARPEGCIILTAHMGNYDIAAPVFARKCARTLYTVRAPERVPELQVIREQELREKEALHPGFKTLYNKEGGMLGIELARLLNEGNLVAVQGDRVLFDVSPMEVEIEPGLKMRMPKGPLFLARATNAPVYPLFIMREGWRRYHVKVFPALSLPPRTRGNDREAERIWANALLETIKPQWHQWFVFEPLLRREAHSSTDP
ncbi:MAG: lysophospholipid acyltransferase family protein [Luteolibacter sp.]